MWDSTINSSKVTVTANSNTVAYSSEWSVSIDPPNQSIANADGSISFKLGDTLPEGSVIDIDLPDNLSNTLSSSTDISEYCWSKTTYTTCRTNSSGEIELTTAVDVSSGTLIELYIEDFFTTGTAAGTTGFNIVADWESVNLVDDTTTYTSDQLFTPGSSLSGATFSVPVVSMTSTTEATMNDVTIQFKVTTGVLATDHLKIQFPREFDPFVGDASVMLSEEPSTYYLDCSSTSLGLCWCTVDKHTVTVMPSTAVEASGLVDITIKNVSNPSNGTTTNKLRVAVVGNDGAYKAYTADLISAGLTTTVLPVSNIPIQSVEANNHYLFSTGVEYTFKFYINSGSLATDESV